MFKKITTEKFPKLMKDTNQCVQEAQKTPSRINLKRSILRHIVIKLTKEKDREDLESSKREVTSHRRSVLVRLTVRLASNRKYET